MKTKILITGSSGFIGTNLVSHLRSDDNELCLIDINKPKVSTMNSLIHQIDIRDYNKLLKAFKEFSPQILIHLAARTDLEEKLDIKGYDVNIQGVENVIRAAENCGSLKRAIYTSSQLVCKIGYSPETFDEYYPDTLYGESKVLTEKIVRKNDGSCSTWCIIRPTSIWGPWMWHFIDFLNLVRKGRYFHIGDAKYRKSFGYIGNFCAQVKGLIDAKPELVHRKTFYLADYEKYFLREWSVAFQEEFGAKPIRTMPLWLAYCFAGLGDKVQALGIRKFPLNSFRLNNILTEYLFDLSPIQSIVPQLPYSIRDGVHLTSNWYLSQIDHNK